MNLKFNFINEKFKYSLFFQEEFKTHRGVSELVEHTEHYEYTAFFEAILDLVPKNKLIIDVGANCGLFCIPICLYGYNVIGFEPVQSNVDCLNLGIKTNNLSNLKINSQALSNENIESEIFVPEYNKDCSSIIKNNVDIDSLKDGNLTIEKIKCIKLDDYIISENIDPKSIGHIKIDVQGYELKVIEGMLNILKEADDISLIVEWDDSQSGSGSLDQIIKLFDEYSIKEISKKGITNYGGNKIFKKI